jgi:hypothetical protein
MADEIEFAVRQQTLSGDMPNPLLEKEEVDEKVEN